MSYVGIYTFNNLQVVDVVRKYLEIKMVRDAGFEPATPTVSVCVTYVVSNTYKQVA